MVVPRRTEKHDFIVQRRKGRNICTIGKGTPRQEREWAAIVMNADCCVHDIAYLVGYSIAQVCLQAGSHHDIA